MLSSSTKSTSFTTTKTSSNIKYSCTTKFNSVVGSISSIAQTAFVAEDPEWLRQEITNYKAQLYVQTQTSVAAETASAVAKVIMHVVEEEILHVDQRNPFLRNSFLKHIFQEEDVQNPQPSALGTIIISLLQNRKLFLENLIAVNIMKGMQNIYTQFSLIDHTEPDFFAKFIVSCLEMCFDQVDAKAGIKNGAKENGTKVAAAKEKLLNESTPIVIVNTILKIAFPNGYNDFIIPPFIPCARETILPKVYTAIFELLRKCVFASFVDISTQ